MARTDKKRLAYIVKMPSFWLSFGLSLFVMLYYVLSQPEIRRIPALSILEIIETKTLDIRFHLRGRQQPETDIVIIAVDEKADDELGRWQSSGRKWIAELVTLLHQAGVKVLGFDLTLAEPDEGAAVNAVDEIKQWFADNMPPGVFPQQRVLNFLDLVKAKHDYDRQLAQAIQEAGNVTLGIYHFLDPQSASHLDAEKQENYQQLIKRVKYSLVKYPPGSSREELRLTHSYGVEPNLPMLSEAAKSFGHFNVMASDDGYIRYSPLLIEYKGDYYPSLDMEMARAFLGISSPPIIYAVGKESGGIVDFIRLGKISIPTDESGRLLINFYGPAYTFPHYSISDVILGRVPPQTFQDKIVILGFTSAIYQDLHSTTFQAGNYPGVEVHATIIENIIHKNFLVKQEWTILLNALVIVAFGLFLGIVLPHTRPHQGALFAIICLLAISGLAYVTFVFQNIWLNFTFPFAFILLDYLVVTTYEYFTEERKKKRIRNLFQHYVSPGVVEQMLNSVDQVTLGGERKELTALFSDIRGFTRISENMSPEELVQFLNEYLSAMTKIVLSYEGTVDKYMGDAIMAFYGAPIRQDAHAVQACKTAVDMIQRLKELHTEWKKRHLPPMEIGIGINTGEMSIGNMGSEERFDYTILGDNVNLASRLEGVNKQYGTNIIISQFTYEQIKHEPFVMRELDSVVVKGKEQPVIIYELRGYGGSGGEQNGKFLQVFADGVRAYKTRQWEQAISYFQQSLNFQPEDSPSLLYIERCRAFQQNPPPEDWDGSYVMTTK